MIDIIVDQPHMLGQAAAALPSAAPLSRALSRTGPHPARGILHDTSISDRA